MPDQADDTRVLTIDEIRRVVAPYARERGMRRARVFGSYARGEADGLSDIDILVDKGGARFLSLGGLAEHVFEATGKRPDVVDVSQLRPGPFRDAVPSEAVPL